jgi:hypothetical protein
MKTTIPLENVSKLVIKVNKLIKRAKKNNVEPMVFTLGEVKTIRKQVSKYVFTQMKVQEVELSGAMPVIEGYEFLAKIEHTSNGNLVKSMIADLPMKYSKYESDCEHCKSKRYRKETYILKSNDKEIQVGTECIKSYMSLNSAEYILNVAAWIKEVSSASELSRMPRTETVIDSIAFIATCIESVKKYGWEPSSFSEEGRVCTSAKAWYFLTMMPAAENYIDYGIAASEESKELAANFINELINTEHSNLLMNNLKIILMNGALTHKETRLIAVCAKMILQAQAEIKEKKVLLNEHVGNVGDKMEVSVKVIKKIGLDSAWGHSIMYLMRDADGRTFKSVTSGSFNAELGENLKLKGTVKKFDMYKDMKQTVLTRIKRIDA